MFCFLLFVLGATTRMDSGWQIQVEDLFQVMRPDEVLVRPDGEVYILHFDEGLILYYGADGQLKRRIGGKGQGPGELTYPTYVCLREEGLYVFDQLNGQVSCFDLEGKFLRRYLAPNRNLNLVRAKGGWIYWAGGFGVKSSQLFWATGDFERPAVLLDISDVAASSSVDAEGLSSETASTLRRPASSMARLDARIARTFAVGSGSITPYFKLVNALDRRDALFYYDGDDDPETGGRPLAALPMLPMLGIEWSF